MAPQPTSRLPGTVGSPSGVAKQTQNDRKPTMVALARRVGCKRSELNELLSRLPVDNAAAERRRLVLDLRYREKLSYAKIAREQGVSREMIRHIVKVGIGRLIDLYKGRADFSARLRKAISDQVGSDEWRLEEVAPKLDCYSLFRTKNVGRTTVKQLHGHLRALNITMRCGCPVAPCASAVRGWPVGPPLAIEWPDWKCQLEKR